MLSFEDFQKVELKTAKVTDAQRVDGSDKLLRLEIEMAGEKRQLVAGIAKHYKPEEMIGKDIVVAANLEPKTIFGLESRGMLLAANVDGRPVLLQPDKEVPSGTVIR
jgi:methionine--tRNA ligase beta chain